MKKRLFDVIFSFIGLIIAGPIILLAAIIIKFSSQGPSFFYARRAGRKGKPFHLLKLRTMHLKQPLNASSVTISNDPRIFPFGYVLRKYKIDELPQLWNILIGDMSFVGPRPEEIEIVKHYYGSLGMRTLSIRPGLMGVSSLFNYTHGEKMIDSENPEKSYGEQLLPIKLALENIYLENRSFSYDCQIMCRTLVTIFQVLYGVKNFPAPPEMKSAQEVLFRHSQSVKNFNFTQFF